MHYQNIIELIQELLENPDFKDDMEYAPKKLYTDESCEERIYTDMCTGDWWFETAASSKC